MALLLRGVCRNHQLLARLQPMMTSRVTMAMTAKQEQDNFWEKNKQLNRPMSPHLTIYSPQVTSMLSITHRGTGVGLTVGIYALGLSMSVLPHDFAYYLDAIKSLSYGPSLLFLTKMAIVWPMAYHTLNGVRHLAWDTGYGFDIKTLYKTGYFVLGLSFVVTAGIAML
ncbi:succinate dehydrogenase cytochrome b560 subunit, mitochondrial-like [Lytechinus pictus]|uniref:succinate dehydrogenase cytochrome b560 subunit, mitochondrial-like n=1 Tax=Lytechinus pictus TaxID=7653 RepID=UPI0030B9BC0E